MTYKLDGIVKNIASPVIVSIDGIETQYPSGEVLTETCFEKPYLITSVSARDYFVVLDLCENTAVNSTDWTDCSVSFF